MKARDELAVLAEAVDQLKESAKHLNISYQRCMAIQKEESENQLIEFEALTSRFARAVDLLVNKVYRSIDAFELTAGGTLIDVVNRADKRGLINSVQEIRLFKDIRNDIAHEYLAERIQILHEDVSTSTPKLLDLIKRTLDYCDKYLHSREDKSKN